MRDYKSLEPTTASPGTVQGIPVRTSYKSVPAMPGAKTFGLKTVQWFGQMKRIPQRP